MKKNRNLRLALALTAVLAVGGSAPSIASRVADYARNANKVDGLHASDLARASSTVASGHISDFKSRGFANVQRTRVEAPVKGVLLVWAGLSAEWDDDSDPGSYSGLTGRVRVDRRIATAPQQVEISRSTRAGTQHLSLSGAVPVQAGSHKVILQLRSARGEAFTYVHQRHIETMFVPFGRNGDPRTL
jgi:hypothetical protein